MAGESAPASGIPLLRGLFGVLQSGSAARLGTAEIWTSLRTAAGTWQARAQGLPQPYDPAQLEAAGREILRGAGVNAAAVSGMRGVAGQWRGAKERLHELEPFAQITSREIFVPPWSETANPAVPDRFRIRSQWQLESAAGDVFTRWKSDEITAPLTSVADALALATNTGPSAAGHGVTLSSTEPVLLDYEIEQI